MSTIETTIVDTIFRNDSNQYSVIQVQSDGETITVVGNFPEFFSGEQVVFSGNWDEHPLYGRQFKASGFKTEQPSTLSSIEKYLSSGLIKGVGPSTANKIVEAFGLETLDIITYQPERLLEVSGIGQKRLEQIIISFNEQILSRKAMMFLQSYDISPNIALRITKYYGEETENIMRTNPYRVVDDIQGIGFLTADRIAQSMGIPPQSPFRIQSGLAYVLYQASNEQGHTYLPRDILISQAAALLKVESSLVEVQMQSMLLSKAFTNAYINDDDAIFLTYMYSAEKEIAVKLQRQKDSAKKSVDSTKSLSQIEDFENKFNIDFSNSQKAAVLSAMQEGVLIITGGPGTGKTTLINCILNLMENPEKTFLAAPTGRAAKRMEEATGHEAKTIHRMLSFSAETGDFQHDEDMPLDCECLIVDEVSMIDVFLMRSLLRAIDHNTRLILVGDADQLPSVGAGNVLKDILNSNVIPTCKLTEIFRQDENSSIVINAHKINHGEMPNVNKKNGDFFMLQSQSAEQTASTIVSLCAKRLPNYLNDENGDANIQVLAPTKKGACGVNRLNKLLQEALNPKRKDALEINYNDITFRKGDKVIHTRNNYQIEWETNDGESGTGVFNGDIGYIINVYEEGLTVCFDESKLVDYEYKQLEDLDLAYCLSVHKSQGSEFSAVVMPVIGGPPMLMTRNLFYTAMTRARKLVVLVGYMSAVESMINNEYISSRYTSLEEQLINAQVSFFNAE